MSVTLVIVPNATTDSFFPTNGGTCDAILADGSDLSYLIKQGYSGEIYNSYGVGVSDMPATGVSSIASVKVLSRWWIEGHANLIHGGFRIGSTNYDGLNYSVDIDTAFAQADGTTYATNPSTAVAWTTTDVNALGWWATAGPFARDGDTIRCALLQFRVTLSLTAPSATTNVASGISSVAATLNGTINPNGATATYPVSYHFQWGLTTGYGNVTSTVSGLTGSSNTPVSSNISGLVANTTYHFRVVASNADGSANGTDQVFTTGAADSIVIGF